MQRDLSFPEALPGMRLPEKSKRSTRRGGGGGSGGGGERVLGTLSKEECQEKVALGFALRAKKGPASRMTPPKQHVAKETLLSPGLNPYYQEAPEPGNPSTPESS